MTDTEVNSNFKGVREEPVDKVYFRKADWISRYAEAMQKTKIMIPKK